LGLTPIGAYDGLQWNSFDVAKLGASPTSGVKPVSGSNVALLYILSGGVFPQAQLQVTGNTKYFQLSSFYYGCVLSTLINVASLPVACSITVNGIRNGKQVATQNFSFTPKNNVLSPLVKASFTSSVWANLDQVVVKPTNLLAPLNSVIFDNVAFTTYSS
jgi:hypothetical protein